jgi:hypothetical protein
MSARAVADGGMLPPLNKTNVCFCLRRAGRGASNVRMKTIHSTLMSLLVVVAIAGCGDASSEEPPPPAALEAVGPSEPDEETGTADFTDPSGEDDALPYPLASAAEFPDDSPDEAAPVPAAPAAPAAKPPGYVETALQHPNRFFKRQVRHPKWNPTGPLFSGNCAPTSLAMAAKVFGKEPAGLTIEQSIDRVRVMMNKPSDSGGASSAQVRLGAQRLGLKLRAMAKGELDSELAKKHVVVLMGYPGLDGTNNASAYQQAFRTAGYYYTFDGFHSIAVLGKTSGGKYVVADPLSKIGVITMSTAQMADYWKRWGGSGTAVWR